MHFGSGRYAVLRDPAGWLNVNPVRGIVNTTASLDRESHYVHDNKYTALFVATDNGNPPATGTGTLIIYLEDYNDNAPYVVPSVARVCEDAHDINVAIVGGRDKDLPPNGAPFKIELGKQLELDNTWRVTRVNSTHSQIMLLHSLKKANYLLPLLITDSGVPSMSNITEVKVQVCECKKNKMLCSSAQSQQWSLALLGTVLLVITAACECHADATHARYTLNISHHNASECSSSNRRGTAVTDLSVCSKLYTPHVILLVQLLIIC
uniref:Cadherin domain-containing protein n=1 Tax=Knipowitschia caucasica TaxID=637954 RepID=A0AAV2KZ76_KNICA